MTALAGACEPRVPASIPWETLTTPMLFGVSRDNSIQLDLGTLWRDLTAGEWTISDTFFSNDRCHTLLKPAARPPDPPTGAQEHHLTVLERVLLNGSQKAIAIDLGMAPSTVAQHCKQALYGFGLSCVASRIPVIVVMALYAFRGLTHRRHAQTVTVAHRDRQCRLVSMARPDAPLAKLLAPAQYDVIRLFVEGKSHAAIAADRGTSTRTVANQLAAVFATLGVSGRCGLLRHLIQSPSKCNAKTARLHTSNSSKQQALVLSDRA